MGVGEEALETGSPMIRYVWLVWLLGVCLLAVYFTAGYVRMYFQLREAIPFTEYAVNDTVVAEICLKLTDKVRIKVSDRIAVPITYGIFRPQIILPRTMDFQDRELLYFVFRHEKIHIKRMDNLWKLLLILALCLHWFNPLVWAMYFAMNHDMEIACDESVISAMEEKDRQKYAMTLVLFAEIQSSFPSMCSGFGQSAVSERIKEIMNYKKITKIGSLCAALILMGSMAVFVSARENVPQAEVDSAPHGAADVKAEKVISEEMAGIDGEKDDRECVEVFFDEGISKERKGEIGDELLSMKQVEGVEYISAETAWAVFADNYLDEDVEISFKDKPLEKSDSYKVYLSEKTDEIIDEIRNIDGVRRIGGQ